MMDTVYRTMPMSQIFGPDAIHDWEYIFRYFNVEIHAVEIGNAVLRISEGSMIAACVYVAFLILYRVVWEWRNSGKES